MSGRSSTIAEEVVAALRQSLGVFEALVLHRRVVEAWSAQSCLPGYTVGGIAGHVVSLMMGFQRRLEARSAKVDMVPYADWYGAALASRDLHAGLIEIGEDLARRGPIRLASALESVGEQLTANLRTATSDVVIPLASVPGGGVDLRDFLQTRFVEIVVHADDIAVSVGLDTPSFPAAAWAVAAAVVSDTTSTEGADAGFVLAASRPGRHR